MMRTWGFARLGLLVLAIAACGPGGRGEGSPSAHIEISPADFSTTITNGGVVVQDYKATLVDADGNKSDITSDVTFAVADPAFGSWAGPSLTITGGAAGPTKIVASDGAGDMGTTGLTVYVKGTRVDGSAPGNADQLFGSATETPGKAPTIAYPADGIIVPPNLGTFDVHWTDTAGNDLFQVELANQYIDLVIYTQKAAPAYTNYTVSEWYSLASTHQQLSLTVAGLNTASPATKGTSNIQHVDATNETVAGGVYYWTTEPTQGVYRYDMSTPNMAPSPFFPPGSEPTTCIGCHGLSKDGTKMALTLDSGDGRGTVFNVADRAVLVPYGTQPYNGGGGGCVEDANAKCWNFATFNPDASKVLTVYHGAMSLRDVNGGAVLASVASSSYATQPELSPDGSRLAYVQTTSPVYDFQVSNGSIVTQSFDDSTNTFGAVSMLVADAPSASNYYPSWSPDGQWILFTRTSGNSYDDATAEIWVVKADGSQPPIQLIAADSGMALTNSWARWTPFQQTFGPQSEPVFYITFSSKRQFGVRPLSSSQWGLDPQIWMAPFFPDRAIAGQDPTGPAFRLPFQLLESGNHIAQWTQAVIIGRKTDGTPLSQAEAYGATTRR
ncbi:MAG: TolB family protein [Acidobacteriota bacterium]